MVRQYLLFIFSFLVATTSLAQEESLDSTKIKPTIIEFSLYIDYGKLITIPSSFERKYEGGLEFLFYGKFPLFVEIGHATLKPKAAYSNGTYESKGFYYRIGAGFSNYLNPKNKIGLSFRYAQSIFDENIHIFIKSTSGAQETYVENIQRKNLKASWYEVVIYSDRKLSNLFSIGLNLRFRILANYDKQSFVDVYSIPGYGLSFNKVVPAANFFLKMSF